MSDEARRHRVALLARRLRLIARRPELQANKQADRVARALPDDAPGYLPLLDAVQIIGASETDRMCGHAIRLLSRPKGAPPRSSTSSRCSAPTASAPSTTRFPLPGARRCFVTSPSAITSSS